MTNNNNIFKYVSLFSGIGGFETALNNLGGECVLASEIDKFAEQAYQVLYGHSTAGDITKVDAKDVPDHDILVGGFPCQAFSVAGKRKGFEDSRGTLFFEVARIAKEKQPKAILLENVKGLVSHDKGRTLDVIVETLNEIGYTVDFDILNSKHFGVPQNRERIFIVAVRDDLIEQESWNIKGNTIIPKGKNRIKEYEWLKAFNFNYPLNDQVTTRLRDILESSVDEKYYLTEDKTSALIAQLEEGWQSKTEPLAEPHMIGHVDIKGHDAIKRVYDPVAISPTLTTMGGGHREPKIVEFGLPIREATKQGYAIAEEGDAVNFQFPESKTRRGRVGKQIANTLEASNINQGVVEKEDAIKSPIYRIRKLTPLECWRLQGFTDEQHQAVEEAGISDSQRYKMAGNAVTVNVIEAIAERLLKYITQ